MKPHCETCTCEPKPKPATCVCIEALWMVPIPPVCSSYSGDDECDNCEHEKACHRAPEVSA